MENRSIPQGRISRNIIFLGTISFFTDVHSEIILPLLPLFLSNVLHASTTYIGLIEGVAEATANIIKGFSGWLSDFIKRRKILIIIGYTISFFSKAGLVAVTTSAQVLGLRFSDRLGKGLRTSPRDALIADSSRMDSYGRSFGIHRAMDTLGAVVGSTLASILMALLGGNIKQVFLVAVLPGAVAVLLTLFVKEIKPKSDSSGVPSEGAKNVLLENPSKISKVSTFLGLGFFYISYMSYAFYILRLKDIGFKDTLIPIAYLVYNIIYTILSIPVGRMSDRLGRRFVIMTGIGGHIIMCLGFVLASSPLYGWLLFILYGFVSAVIETVPKAYVSDITRFGFRGGMFGWYNMLIGFAGIASNLIAGLLWDRFGASATFIFSGGVALMSLLFLLWRQNENC